MPVQTLNILTLMATFLTIFGSAEFFYHQFNLRVEWSRKYVHCAAGLMTLLFPVMLGSHWLVLMMSVCFAVILFFSKKLNLLKSIHNIERKSKGAILYPIAIYFCFLMYDLVDLGIFFYLPVLIMAVSDPVAALCGKRFPRGNYQIGSAHKTVVGSGAFMISAFMICFGVFSLLWQLPFYLMITCSIGIAVATTVVEAVSGNGSDNITIPACVLFILFWMHHYFGIL